MTPHRSAPSPSGLRFSAYIHGRYTVAALGGELDIACAPTLREQLLGVLRPDANRLVIDLSHVTFCDASGLAVLVGTGRRARLLGGGLRLAAPAPAVAAALRLTGLNLQFGIFPTVSAATNGLPARQLGGDFGADRPASVEAGVAGRAMSAAEITPGAGAPSPDDLRKAVGAVLLHADAWRDADPARRFTFTLRALARAHAGEDRTALLEAARSLLFALTRHPLTHSPAVAATATNLRLLLRSASEPGR